MLIRHVAIVQDDVLGARADLLIASSSLVHVVPRPFEGEGPGYEAKEAQKQTEKIVERSLGM